MAKAIKVGDTVVHHFNGGTVRGKVLRVNAKSARVAVNDGGWGDGREVTYKLNQVTACCQECGSTDLDHESTKGAQGQIIVTCNKCGTHQGIDLDAECA